MRKLGVGCNGEEGLCVWVTDCLDCKPWPGMKLERQVERPHRPAANPGTSQIQTLLPLMLLLDFGFPVHYRQEYRQGDETAFGPEFSGPSTTSGLDSLVVKKRENTKMGGNSNPTEDKPQTQSPNRTSQ